MTPLLTVDQIKAKPFGTYKFISLGSEYRLFSGDYDHVSALKEGETRENVTSAGRFAVFSEDKTMKVQEKYSSTLNKEARVEDWEELEKMFGFTFKG